MRILLGSLVVAASLAAFARPAPLGPHAVPAPGAVLEAFPEKVHAWHSIQAKEEPVVDLHRASHIVVKGPDGLWVDGIVHVGNHVSFLADHPDRLVNGTYKVSTVARWADGGADDSFSWEFSVEKKGD